MSRSLASKAVLLCTPWLLSACQQPPAEAASIRCGTDPTVEAQLAEVMDRHVAAHFAQDPVAAAADYTDDVWFRMDGGVELRTRATMEELYGQMYETMRLVDLEHTPEEVTVCGDAAHAVGHYVETVESDGQQTTTRYDYMMLWRLQPDGAWKLSRGALIAAPPAA